MIRAILSRLFAWLMPKHDCPYETPGCDGFSCGECQSDWAW